MILAIAVDAASMQSLGSRLESQRSSGGMMNPNRFKHAFYVMSICSYCTCIPTDRHMQNTFQNPLPRPAYLGPLDPHWQSLGGHFGRCSHGMDGASLCTTSGGTGVLYQLNMPACNVSFHSDSLEF